MFLAQYSGWGGAAVKLKKYISFIIGLLLITAGCGAGIDPGSSDSSDGSDTWSGITTLTQVEGTRSSISWIVPDSPPSGEAIAQYNIRYSTEAITAENFDSATSAIDAPTPVAAGELQTHNFGELIPNTTYFAVVQMIDAEGTASAISNMAVVKTDYRSISMSSITTNLNPGRMVVGDVDGDGYDDVLVGSSIGEGGSEDTDIYLFYGGPELSLDDPAQFINPGEKHFGEYTALSDVNGDGKMDVLIHHHDTDTPSYGIWVYYGERFTGEVTFGEADRIITDDDNSSYFAAAFADLGDIDGDGKSDIAVGDYRAGVGNDGQVRIYTGLEIDGTPFGGSTPFTAFQPVNLTASADFGRHVGSPGDLNADGFRDLVVGASRYGDWECGRTYVFFGSASGFTATPGRTIDPPSTYRCNVDGSFYIPWTGSNLGDINNTGYPDLVTFFYTQPADGVIYDGNMKIFAGGENFASEVPEELDVGFIFPIMPAGDTNNDGINDLLFVQLFATDNVIMGGAPIDLNDSFVVFSEELSIVNGIGVDLNDDGVTEILLGHGTFPSSGIGRMELLY
jgi:FG-GAP-like repeat/FG-GAP repeat